MDGFKESMALAARVKHVRENAGMNRAEFAKALGVSPAYVTYLEKGEKAGEPVKPSEQFFFNFAIRFGVDVAWIKGGTGDPKKTRRQELIGRIMTLPESDLEDVMAFIDSLKGNGRAAI